MGVPKISDPFPIKIKMPNPSQDPPVFSKAPNQNFKDMDVLGALKIKMRTKILNMGLPKTSDYIQIKIKMPNPNQDPPGSF